LFFVHLAVLQTNEAIIFMFLLQMLIAAVLLFILGKLLKYQAILKQHLMNLHQPNMAKS
jgi:hypothetical protein